MNSCSYGLKGNLQVHSCFSIAAESQSIVLNSSMGGFCLCTWYCSRHDRNGCSRASLSDIQPHDQKERERITPEVLRLTEDLMK